MRILVINGPNLNLLGEREPQIYGRQSLSDIQQMLRQTFPDAELRFFQSNDEGQLIDRLHGAMSDGTNGIVFNPAAYAHTSIALRDAVAAIGIPVVEVHLSNIHAREDFRRHSMIAGVAAGVITGLGAAGYELAVRYLLARRSDAG